MTQIKTYQLPPTSLIPNSPRPVIHYSGILSPDSPHIATDAYDLFTSNGWETQWIFRYAQTQDSHYHSEVHECMAVLSGSAIIRFGVADTHASHIDGTHGSDHEEGGLEVYAEAGDIFLLPAGVAHKTFNAKPLAPFALLTPGDGHHLAAEDKRRAIADVNLSGFTMLGAYPKDAGTWDFLTGGNHTGSYEKIWTVPKPENDPALGKADNGLCGQWV